MQHTVRGSTLKRVKGCIKNLLPFFSGATVRNITAAHCERWVVERGPKVAAQTFAHDLGAMKAVLQYAVAKGYLIENPAEGIKRKKIIQAEIQVPTREQFELLVAAIRQSDGRQDSQEKAADGANLVELMAYSGCRVSEATSLRWADIDFDRNVFVVRQAVQLTKNGTMRTVSMNPVMRALAEKLKGENNPQATDFLSPIKSTTTRTPLPPPLQWKP